MIYDVIIIGAGASGLMAAIQASHRGKTVLLLEQNGSPGKKILISGGGRCNFTNRNLGKEYYFSQKPNFCKSALKEFGFFDFEQWLQKAGIDYFEKTEGQLFCKGSSRQILTLLKQKLLKTKVVLKTNTKVIEIQKEDASSLFVVKTKEHTERTRNLIIATGGISYPQLGVSDFGYTVAREFGHEVTEIYPALVGLKWAKQEQRHFVQLSGVSVRVRFKTGKKNIHDQMLFTHKGISGPAVLQGSLFWSEQNKVCLDILPEVTDFFDWMHRERQQHSKKTLYNFLAQYFPIGLVRAFCEYRNISDKKLATVSKQEVNTLYQQFKNWEFVPKETFGFKEAEVTRGGVSTEFISQKTMESKLVKGLYFTGEVLDVTGMLGGYNLQWAWSSGYLAGNHIV